MVGVSRVRQRKGKPYTAVTFSPLFCPRFGILHNLKPLSFGRSLLGRQAQPTKTPVPQSSAKRINKDKDEDED